MGLVVLSIGSLTANVYVTHVRVSDIASEVYLCSRFSYWLTAAVPLCFSCMLSTAETGILICLTEWFRRGSCSSSSGTVCTYSLVPNATFVYFCACLPISLGELHLSWFILCCCVNNTEESFKALTSVVVMFFS